MDIYQKRNQKNNYGYFQTKPMIQGNSEGCEHFK